MSTASSAEAPAPTAVPLQEAPAATGTAIADLPLRRDDSPPWQTGGMNVFAAFAVVLVLCVVAVWLLRRLGGRRWLSTAMTNAGVPGVIGAPTSGLTVVRSARLAARASVHVVRWDGRDWLVGCTDQHVNLLGSSGASGANGASASGDANQRDAPSSTDAHA